ncbi:ParA family protein [Microbacterium enclense]|uniref:ParA family protein n=1 Tax=Microbacterium enclense TaxID=993073 RepID=UPI003F7ECB6B
MSREALAPVVDDYVLALMDSARSLDQLTINAPSAAEAAVIVTHTKEWSLDGLGSPAPASCAQARSAPHRPQFSSLPHTKVATHF